jgi:hypothetical protein
VGNRRGGLYPWLHLLAPVGDLRLQMLSFLVIASAQNPLIRRRRDRRTRDLCCFRTHSDMAKLSSPM